MKHSYIIFDCDEAAPLDIRKVMSQFPDFFLENVSFNFNDALDAVLEFVPQLLFIRCKSDKVDGFRLIAELHRHLNVLPRIIVISDDDHLAYQAIKYGVFDYLIEPFLQSELRRCFSKFEKFQRDQATNLQSKQPLKAILGELTQSEITGEKTEVASATTQDSKNDELIICIKSYGDYRYIESSAICYLKADNNSTDIHLKSGDVITAFKTLKTFETVLTWPFYRVHNSYIVNLKSIARIHTGTATLYLKGGNVKIPFSKSYKSNIEQIIGYFEDKNYLEF